MGVRMDWVEGLNRWATELVAQATKKEPSGEYFLGMFGDEHPLCCYYLPDGSFVREDIQAVPWASGPHFFFALRDEEGNWIPESLWSPEEIDSV
jgi:hypothetical protein